MVPDLELHDSIATLLSFSLVHRGHDANAISFHPLVHTWARERLGEVQRREVAENAFNLIAATVKSINPNVLHDWIFRSHVMPHLTLCCAWAEKLVFVRSCSVGVQTAQGCRWIAWLYKQKSRYDEALGWYLRALELNRILRGESHHDTLDTMHQKATVHTFLGQHQTALDLLELALTGYKDDPDKWRKEMLQVLNDIGWAHYCQGNLTRAMDFYEQALSGRMEALGPDDLDTSTTILHIGILYLVMRRNEEALARFKACVVKYEKHLGSEHPATLQILRYIASAYGSQGRYTDALEMYYQALKKSEGVFGESENIVDIVRCIGFTYSKLDKHEDALKWSLRALHESETLCGELHEATLQCVYNAAGIHVKLDRHDEAQRLYERAVAGYRKIRGERSEPTLNAAHGLALSYFAQGKYDSALSYYMCLSTETDVFRAMEGESTINISGQLVRQPIDVVEQFLSQATETLKGNSPDLAAVGREQFALRVTSPEDKNTIEHLAFCDRCHRCRCGACHFKAELIKGVRYRCSICEDQDLCEPCYEIYRKEGISVGECKDHEYIRIPRENWSGQWGDPTQSPLELLKFRWLRYKELLTRELSQSCGDGTS